MVSQRPHGQAAMEQQKERSRAALREQQVLVDMTKGRMDVSNLRYHPDPSGI